MVFAREIHFSSLELTIDRHPVISLTILRERKSALPWRPNGNGWLSGIGNSNGMFARCKFSGSPHYNTVVIMRKIHGLLIDTNPTDGIVVNQLQ